MFPWPEKTLVCFQRTVGKVNIMFTIIVQIRYISGMVISMTHSSQICLTNTITSFSCVSSQKEVVAMSDSNLSGYLGLQKIFSMTSLAKKLNMALNKVDEIPSSVLLSSDLVIFSRLSP